MTALDLLLAAAAVLTPVNTGLIWRLLHTERARTDRLLVALLTVGGEKAAAAKVAPERRPSKPVSTLPPHMQPRQEGRGGRTVA